MYGLTFEILRIISRNCQCCWECLKKWCLQNRLIIREKSTKNMFYQFITVQSSTVNIQLYYLFNWSCVILAAITFFLYALT